MKKKPLISVIITYYKKISFIKSTLQSIFNQTYKNYEIIFVYDQKEKKDLAYIKKILSKFKKKKIIINNKNLGVAKSRNIAIKNAKGNYLAFIDADDIWKKNKLFTQLKFMKKNSCHFSFTSYAEIDESNKITKERKVLFDAYYTDLYKSNFIGLSTVMVHNKIFSKIHFPNLTTQEDFALWLKLLRNGTKIKCLNKTLSFWRRTKNSLSSNSYRKLLDAFKLYYQYEKKNFIIAIFSVIVLSCNKIIKKFN